MNSKTRRATQGTVSFPRHYGSTSKPLKPLITPLISAGFDIEADSVTADPYLFCAYASDGRRHQKILTQAEDPLAFLALPIFSRTINGFWNIGYDSEGILRFLPDSIKYLLSKNPEVFLSHDLSPTTKENYQYHLRIIPKKLLVVRHVLGTQNKFFDFQQFFGKESLNKVSKRVLGEQKDGLDASKSSKERFFNDTEYREAMIKYCTQDARLTALLGLKLIKSIHSFLPTKNFTSCASIAEQYVTRNGYYTPKSFRQNYLEFLLTYWGGRFELFKRGYIPNTHSSDLKSAYPWAMSIMPILTDGFICRRVTTGDYDPTAKFGAYRIHVSIPEDKYVAPIPVQTNGPIMYPTGQFEAWVDKETLEYLSREGYDFLILEGQEILDDNATFALAPCIKTLFAIKENKSEDEGIRQAAKIILNSIYGKMIQLIDDVEGFLTDLETAIEQNLPVDSVTPHGIFATRHTNIFKCGRMFNPAYGSFTTAKTRIRLMDAASEVGWKNVVAFQTDSITTILNRLPVIKGLGGWDYKGRYDLAIGKSGFYDFQNTGEEGMDPLWKIFNTSHELKARSYGNISEITQEEYMVKRRNTLKQSAARHDFTNLNVIGLKPIKNNINTDSKRLWNSPITFDDLRPGGRMVDSTCLNLQTVVL